MASRSLLCPQFINPTNVLFQLTPVLKLENGDVTGNYTLVIEYRHCDPLTNAKDAPRMVRRGKLPQLIVPVESFQPTNAGS